MNFINSKLPSLFYYAKPPFDVLHHNVIMKRDGWVCDILVQQLPFSIPDWSLPQLLRLTCLAKRIEWLVIYSDQSNDATLLQGSPFGKYHYTELGVFLYHYTALSAFLFHYTELSAYLYQYTELSVFFYHYTELSVFLYQNTVLSVFMSHTRCKVYSCTIAQSYVYSCTNTSHGTNINLRSMKPTCNWNHTDMDLCQESRMSF